MRTLLLGTALLIGAAPLPDLAWSTFLGGSGTDRALAVAVDDDGFVYVGGLTASADFPATAGGYAGGSEDAFVAKLTPDGGTLIWATFLGGSGLDRVIGIDVDADGFVYVTGETTSLNFPATAGAFDTTNAGYDAFAAKLDPSSGALIYSTLLGGSKEDVGRSVRVDAAGRATVVGWTKSGNFPTTVGAFQTTFGGIYDAFALRLSADGSSLEYSTYLGGPSTDLGLAVDVDAAGAAWIAGYAHSTSFPATAGAFDSTHNGGADCFVTRLAPDGGSAVYSTFLGGAGSDTMFGHGIDVDDAGFAYVAGRTTSADFPAAGYNGGGDAFVVVLEPFGTGLLYSTYLGGAGNEEAYAVRVGADGRAHVAGHTSSADFPADTAPNGGLDVFVTTLDAAGAIESSTRLGGAADESARDLALGPGDAVHVAGGSASAGYPTTAGAYDTALAGPSDAIVTKLGGADVTPPTLVVATPTECLWPPNHKLRTIDIVVVATDDTDPAPAIVLVSVTSSEPDEGTGDGDAPNDIQNAAVGTADTQISLRAERSALGGGRTYTLTYVAVDAAGNVSEPVSVEVCVPKSMGGG